MVDASGFSDRGDDPFKPGDVVEGRYKVIRRLSAGGVGAVYEVEHAFTGMHVALKALHNQSGDNPERMRAEARTLAEMRHPNIVQITDGGVTDRTVWFTMELLNGRTLREEILRAGPMSIARALRFGMQISEGVAVAHAAGVIHRDLKPENIFVVAEGDGIKILDFGTSKITSKQRRSAMLKTTDRFRLIGTQAYMPPERLRAGLADARADVYAVGHMLYEMIAGRHCWSEGPGPLDLPPPQELGLRQIYTTPRPLHEHASDVPDWIEHLVLRALAKDPDHRQQSMQEIATALRAALERYTREHPVEAPRAARPVPPTVGLPTEPVVPMRSTEVTTREQPLWAVSGPPMQAADDRARIDALLVCGAARFAAGSTEPDELEKGLKGAAAAELADAGRRGMLRVIAHASAEANPKWRESVRRVICWIGRSEGVEQEQALQQLVRSLEKRGWKPDGDRIEPLPHAELALGAAMLLDPERRLDSAENALVRLRDLGEDVQSLAVSVMVAFARTSARLHPAPRGALLALLLGGPEDSELAHSELAQFVLNAAAASDPAPVRVVAPMPTPERARPPVTPTPSAVAAQRSPMAQPVQEAVPQRTPAKMGWVIGIGALASGLVLAGGFAMKSRASVPAAPAVSAAQAARPEVLGPPIASAVPAASATDPRPLDSVEEPAAPKVTAPRPTTVVPTERKAPRSAASVMRLPASGL